MTNPLFQEKVTQLNKMVDRSFFPENFLNEVYYSKIEHNSKDTIAYTSNFSIKYVLHGKEVYFLNGKKYAPNAGQYLLINNGREIETSPTKGSEGISIFLDKKLITEVYHTLTTKEEAMLDHGTSTITIPCPEFFENNFHHQDSLGALLQSLSYTIKMNPLDGQKLKKETYYQVAEKLIQTQKNVSTGIGRISRIKKSTREELYKKALLAKEYIHGNLRSDFNLNLLSKNVGLSKYHLIRIFKSTFFQTPYQYFIICKINKVKHYLKESNYSLVEIAFLCGFNDVFMLSKTFKKIVGITPSEFRRFTK